MPSWVTTTTRAGSFSSSGWLPCGLCWSVIPTVCRMERRGPFDPRRPATTTGAGRRHAPTPGGASLPSSSVLPQPDLDSPSGRSSGGTRATYPECFGAFRPAAAACPRASTPPSRDGPRRPPPAGARPRSAAPDRFSISGQTCSRTAATIAAFSSAGRARRAVAIAAHRLASGARFKLAPSPRPAADDASRPLTASALTFRGQVLRADDVEDDVRALPSVASRSSLDEVLLAVVDEDRPRPSSRKASFSGPPAVTATRAPDRLGELDRHGADTAAPPWTRSARRAARWRDHEDVRPDRAGRPRAAPRRRPGPGRPAPAAAARPVRRPSRRTPAGQQRADLVADGPAATPRRAATIRPEHSSPGYGDTGRRVVEALPLQQVGAVHGRGDDLDQDLALAGLGIGHVGPDKCLGPPGSGIVIAFTSRAYGGRRRAPRGCRRRVLDSASSTGTVVCRTASSERAAIVGPGGCGSVPLQGHSPYAASSGFACPSGVGGDRRVDRRLGLQGGRRQPSRRGGGGEGHVAREDDDQLRVDQQPARRPPRRPGRRPRGVLTGPPHGARVFGLLGTDHDYGPVGGQRVEEAVEDRRRRPRTAAVLSEPSGPIRREPPPQSTRWVATGTGGTGDGTDDGTGDGTGDDTGQSASATQAVPTRRKPTDS